jgi:uncharacterized membrane protein YhaH (DUF805 family)
MNPIESITTCFKKYATFSGRASRSEFWWFYLAYILVLLIGGEITEYAFLAFFAMVIPYLAVAVRRMHDGNHSGWWIIVPIVNLVFLASAGTDGPNKFGDISIERL